MRFWPKIGRFQDFGVSLSTLTSVIGEGRINGCSCRAGVRAFRGLKVTAPAWWVNLVVRGANLLGPSVSFLPGSSGKGKANRWGKPGWENQGGRNDFRVRIKPLVTRWTPG